MSFFDYVESLDPSQGRWVYKQTITCHSLDQVSIFEHDGTLYAIKSINLNKAERENRCFIRFQKENELELLNNAKENVVKIQNIFYYKNESIHLAMEYYNQNLKQFIQSQGILTLQAFLPLFQDMILGKYVILNS